MNYQVWIKDTDSCFFDGTADNADDAAEKAIAAYENKWPGENGSIVEWVVVEAE